MNERDKELAKQAWTENDWDGHVKWKKFADLIRADEREACAKVARKIANKTNPDDWALDKCYEIEEAIRARGNT